MEPSTLQISVKRPPAGPVIVAARGEIDIASAPLLRDSVEVELDTADDVMLDLRGVGFIDSTGIGALVALDRQAVRSGRRLLCVRGADTVMRVLEITGVDVLLTWAPGPPLVLVDDGANGDRAS